MLTALLGATGVAHASPTPMVQAPALLLWGDQDQEVGRHAMESMAAKIPRARLMVFPGAGHFPFQDAPDEFRRRLTEFLQREDRE